MAGTGADRQIRNGRILCLPGTVRYHRRVPCGFRHRDRFKRLCQRANLIEFNQDRISDAFIDSSLEDLCIGDKEIVANQLNLIAQFFSQYRPTRPVGFIQTVFDGNNRVRCSQIGEIVRESRTVVIDAVTLEVISPVAVEL